MTSSITLQFFTLTSQLFEVTGTPNILFVQSVEPEFFFKKKDHHRQLLQRLLKCNQIAKKPTGLACLCAVSLLYTPMNAKIIYKKNLKMFIKRPGNLYYFVQLLVKTFKDLYNHFLLNTLFISHFYYKIQRAKKYLKKNLFIKMKIHVIIYSKVFLKIKTLYYHIRFSFFINSNFSKTLNYFKIVNNKVFYISHHFLFI